MAIKGKTKRSAGRPVRRPATAPRAQILERRQPWYKATAFPVTLAVIVLAITLFVAWNRMQLGWSRDDVRRFADQVRVQTDQLSLALGAGTQQVPGMATATDFSSGKLKGKDLQVRASGWSARIGELQQKVASITVGTPEALTALTGAPPNSVGGHVPMLTSVRDAYSTAFGFYAQAAAGYQNAGAASGGLAAKLVTQAQSDSAKAGEAMDSAASMLARVMVHYHLPVSQQMPGESSAGFGNRTGAAQMPPGGLGVDQNGQPINPTQVPGQAPSPTGSR